MLSAASIWAGRWKKNQRWSKVHLPVNYGKLWLDSGGYSFFSMNWDYPFTIEEYARKADELNADYVSVLDYPCEKTVERVPNETNYERIDRTIANTKECLKHQIRGRWVPVIQGLEIEEYRYAINELKGILDLIDYVAVGSMCSRRKLSEIKEVVTLLNRELPNHRIHAFGVDFRALRSNYVYNSIYSADSQAWRFFIPNKTKEHRFASSRSEVVQAFSNYSAKIEGLHSGLLDSYQDAEIISKEVV